MPYTGEHIDQCSVEAFSKAIGFGVIGCVGWNASGGYHGQLSTATSDLSW